MVLRWIFCISVLMHTNFSYGTPPLPSFHWTNFWSGEYPSPVVNVLADTKIDGVINYRKKTKSNIKACTLPRGQYHPWSMENKDRYVSGQPILHYKARSRTMLHGVIKGQKRGSRFPLRKNSLISVFSYLSEGQCLLSVGKKAIELVAECPDPKKFEPLNKVNMGRERQLFKADCKEGFIAWIEVNKALFKNKSIEQGSHMGWGKLKPLPNKDGSFNASFPCQKAQSKTEKLICSKPELAELDYYLGLKYKEIKKSKPKKEQNLVLQSQRLWLKKRNKACTKGHQACFDSYSQRLSFFEYLEYSRIVQLGSREHYYLIRSNNIDDATLRISLYDENEEIAQEFDVESNSKADSFVVIDANFDGELDLLIPEYGTAGPNTNYTIMLYGQNGKILSRSEGLSSVMSPEFKKSLGAVVSLSRLHAAGYMKTYYKWYKNHLLYAGAQINECKFNKDMGSEVCLATIKDQNTHIVQQLSITPDQIMAFKEVTKLPDIDLKEIGVCTIWSQGDALHLKRCFKEYKRLCPMKKTSDQGKSMVKFTKMNPNAIESHCQQEMVKNARDVEFTMAGLWGAQVWDYSLKVGAKVKIYQEDIDLLLQPNPQSQTVEGPIKVGSEVEIIAKGANRTIVEEYSEYSAYWFQVRVIKTGAQGYVFGPFLHPNPSSRTKFIQ